MSAIRAHREDVAENGSATAVSACVGDDDRPVFEAIILGKRTIDARSKPLK